MSEETKPPTTGDSETTQDKGRCAPATLLCDDQPFKSSHPGHVWTISEGRYVAVWSGENNDVMIRWDRDGKQTHVRLSQEAAKSTIIALVMELGVPGDPALPQVA